MQPKWQQITAAQLRAGWFEQLEDGTTIRHDYEIISRAENGVDYLVIAPELQLAAMEIARDDDNCTSEQITR